jgi:type I site-specific restriction endonuclease
MRDGRSAGPHVGMTFNEAQTRVQHIDPQLRSADWKLNDRTQVRLEVPVDGYDAEPWNGVTDYCLYDASGNVLAVVEARRVSKPSRTAWARPLTNISSSSSESPYGQGSDRRHLQI